MALPTTIQSPDGSLCPFDPDSVSRSLFAATDRLGHPNSFLARELTDGVLHFLAGEELGETISAVTLTDMVVKVVRELGQPAIAKAYELSSVNSVPKSPIHPPKVGRFAAHRSLVEKLLADFALEHVFSSDLVAAHRDGFLDLLDAAYPVQLRSVPFSLTGLSPHDPNGVFQRLEAAKRTAGRSIVVDRLDVWLAEHRLSATEVERFLMLFEAVVGASGLEADLHLNRTSSADEPNVSLFGATGRSAGEIRQIAELLAARSKMRVGWHVGREETSAPVPSERVRLVLQSCADPVAVLGRVELRLGLFVDLLAGGNSDRNLLLRKFRSLARMARAVGAGRYRYLQIQGDDALRQGFMLDRAVFEVVPRGLVEAAARLLGRQADESPVVELTCQIVQTIDAVFREPSSVPVSTQLVWEPEPFRPDAGIERSLLGPIGEGNSIISRQLRHVACLGRDWAMCPVCVSAEYLSTDAPARLSDLIHAARRAGAAYIFSDR